MKMTYVIRGGNLFGMGNSPEEARKFFKKAGGQLSRASSAPDKRGFVRVEHADDYHVEIDGISGSIITVAPEGTVWDPKKTKLHYGKENFK